LKINSNFIFPATPKYSEQTFNSHFLTKTLYAFLLFLRRVTCPAHTIILDLVTLIIFGED
jgi:hypothetical protein